MKYKTLTIIIIMNIFINCAFANTWVKGYTRHDGTYVSGHYRSNANYTRLDNYSSRGNYNPYTGKRGTVNPYSRYGSAYNNGYQRRKYSTSTP